MQEPRLIPLKTLTSDIVKVCNTSSPTVNHTGLKLILMFTTVRVCVPQMQLYVEERAQKM